MRQLASLMIFGIRLATLVLIIYWVALFTGTHMPSPPKVSIPYADKVQHFSAFFGLAMLLCWVIPTSGRPGRKIALVLLIAIPYAAFDEWSQRFTSVRMVDINDFYADTAGILTATACYAAGRRLLQRRGATRCVTVAPGGSAR